MNTYLIIVSVALYILLGVIIWLSIQYNLHSPHSDVAIDFGKSTDWEAILLWPGVLVILIAMGVLYVCFMVIPRIRIPMPRMPRIKMPRWVIKKGDPLT